MRAHALAGHTQMVSEHAGIGGFARFVAHKKLICTLIGKRFALPRDPLHGPLFASVHSNITLENEIKQIKKL